MALIDAKYRFIWANAGFPGNSHDSVILQATELWQKITSGETIPLISKKIGQSDVPPLIVACVILHNICIDKGDALSPQLNLTVDPTSQKQRDRDTVRKLLQMRNCPKVKNTSRKANAICDDIMEYLWSERKNVQ
ncbi:Hypothetical predicted protein [Paramuricea clavata]|uniref:Uncharacterized protein n=1 Tax=Paramuricea clavata TaxID=317549 RepID=A0A7D9DDR4_PARCT|nr:Hypothetical predicted protein [Paramuricea clavata]